MKKVALITLHGMGKVNPSYYSKLEEGLRKRLDERWLDIAFYPVQYAPSMQSPQNDLWDAMVSERKNDLDATKLRQFFLFSFGDAAALEYSQNMDKKTYIGMQAEIQKALDLAYLDMGKDPTKPVVIIAHSLGCQFLSNYLWDATHGSNIFSLPLNPDSSLNEFRKLVTLKNLITTGCNIPLFVGGLPIRTCFDKPNAEFKWDNYFDPDDVLGWPLRQLGATYQFVEDHPINSGGLFTSWNPFSHSTYWSDGNVLDPLEEILSNLISRR